MRFPWKKAIDAARAGAQILQRQRSEPPLLQTCPVDGSALIRVRDDLQICSRGHRYGPNEPRGELINQGDHRGPI